MTNDTILPNKCCAKCGFLYGLARRPASRDDAVFDPDLLRSEELERNYMPGRYARGVITSQPYTKVVTFTDRSEKLEAGNFTWADTHSICCYWRKFTHHIPALSKPVVYDDEELQYVPIGHDDVISTIRQDRNDCDGFFEYFAGLSPKQHAELRLEERRTQRMLEHEANLTKWSMEQEKRIHRITLEAERKWRESERRLTIRFGIIAALLTVFEIVVLFVTSRP